MVQLWLAQKVLRENGITLLLLVTPSKVETLPEYLPFPYRQAQAKGARGPRLKEWIDVKQRIYGGTP